MKCQPNWNFSSVHLKENGDADYIFMYYLVASNYIFTKSTNDILDPMLSSDCSSLLWISMFVVLTK